MFQAQKLMAETQVASARFIPRRVPVLGTVAVLTLFTEPVERSRGVNLAEILQPTSTCIGVVSSPAPTFVLGAHLLTLKILRRTPGPLVPTPTDRLVLARACRHPHRASRFGKRPIAV